MYFFNIISSIYLQDKIKRPLVLLILTKFTIIALGRFSKLKTNGQLGEKRRLLLNYRAHNSRVKLSRADLSSVPLIKHRYNIINHRTMAAEGEPAKSEASRLIVECIRTRACAVARHTMETFAPLWQTACWTRFLGNKRYSTLDPAHPRPLSPARTLNLSTKGSLASGERVNAAQITPRARARAANSPR